MSKLKKSKTIKKELPARFQEVLAESEIQLSEKLSVDVLKKLVYLYSLAMQHYSLDNKNKLQDFYNQKLISLLTRKDVAEFLDKNKVNINDTSDLNLFPEETIKNKNKSTGKYTGKKFKIAPNFDKEKALKEIREKIKNVDIYLEKITREITQDTMEQSAQFNTRRRKESIKKIVKEEEEEPPKRSAESIGSVSDSENEEDKAFFAEIQKSAELAQEEEKKQAPNKAENSEGISKLKLENINNNIPNDPNMINNPPSCSSKKSSGRRGSLGNPKYLEIETMKRNLLEKENQDILNLQKEYEAKMEEFKENPDFVEIYKEELQDEIDSLHQEYLNIMTKETEKIEKKYDKMKNNLLALYQNQ